MEDKGSKMGYTTTANTQMMSYVQRLLTLAPGEFLFLFFYRSTSIYFYSYATTRHRH